MTEESQFDIVFYVLASENEGSHEGLGSRRYIKKWSISEGLVTFPTHHDAAHFNIPGGAVRANNFQQIINAVVPGPVQFEIVRRG